MSPGVPSVFYGDEKRIAGIREDEYRRGMPWEESRTDEETFVQTVIEIRKKWISPHDDYSVLLADKKKDLLVFERNGLHRIRVLIHLG